MMKISNFHDDLADISVKTEPLFLVMQIYFRLLGMVAFVVQVYLNITHRFVAL